MCIRDSIKKICFEKLVMMDSYNNITQKTGLKERNINATALVDIEDILKGELISHRELILSLIHILLNTVTTEQARD